MTLDKAIESAIERASRLNCTQVVLYNAGNMSPDHRSRYEVARFDATLVAGNHCKWVVTPDGVLIPYHAV